jgi:IclR family mhp operon transcriptional activator
VAHGLEGRTGAEIAEFVRIAFQAAQQPSPWCRPPVGETSIQQWSVGTQLQLRIVPLCGTIRCMKRPTENRSLDRGLAILETLSIHGASSLRDLHARTGLPKSTIRRLLGTLIRLKIVRRSLADRQYRANIALPLRGRLAASHAEGWLVDCAVPHIIELTREAGWACDLHIFERTRSRIIESTRPLSPFFQYVRPIDLQVPVFGSAAGLAVLSTWPDAAILALVNEIGDDPVWGLRCSGLTPRELVKFLHEVREAGLASRPRRYRGETVMANTLSAIACPIHRARTAVGAVAMLWPKNLLPPAAFADLHGKKLAEAAARISVDLSTAA